MNSFLKLTVDQGFSAVDLELLSQLYDYAPDVAFFVKDRDGRYLMVNNSLANRYGWKDKSEVIGLHSSELCEGEFGQLPSEQDEQVLSTGRPLIEHLEMQWIRPRVPVWCLTTKLPVLNPGGNPIGIIGFSRDLRVPIEVDEVPTHFAKALEHFEETLSEAVTPAWLAEQSKLSPQQLVRLTKRLFGLTPTQLITKIRIGRACRNLDATDRPIADIALGCGFYDHSAFTRAFRSAIGVTPTDYRKGKSDKKKGY